MSFEGNVRGSFGRVKDDVEGVKDELALALKRIVKLEEVLGEIAIRDFSKSAKKKPKKKKKLTWKQHLAKTRRKYPKKTLKEAMIIASMTYKRKGSKK